MKMKKRLLAAVVAILMTVLMIPTDYKVAATGSTYDVNYSVTYGQSEARSMLDALNSWRTGATWYWNSDNITKTEFTNGQLSGLTYDYGLESIAMQRAAEIAASYSHTRPNGTDWITAYTYPYGYGGENIAYGYLNANAVYEAWREDNENYSGQGHRRNMLNSNFNYIGIGHCVVNGRHYWVQEFSNAASGATATSANDGVQTVTVSVLGSDIVSRSATMGDLESTPSVGSSLNLPSVTTTIRLSEGVDPVSLSNVELTWGSSDTGVATISDGKVNVVSGGSFTLTATSNTCGEAVQCSKTFTVGGSGSGSGGASGGSSSGGASGGSSGGGGGGFAGFGGVGGSPTSTATETTAYNDVKVKTSSLGLKSVTVDTATNGTAMITGLRVASGAKVVKVPSKVKVKGTSYKVKIIGSGALEGCEQVTTITIPKAVTKIESVAFDGGDNLRIIKINTKKSIKVQKGAFGGTDTTKMTIKVSKKMSKKTFNTFKKTLVKAGYLGKVERTL